MTPDDNTIQELFLDVGDGHKLYVHDWGKKTAKVPIIFLHGGPGNGVDNGDKKKFDPKNHRVIYFDQRGAGKSTPTASLAENTSEHLVADIDKIADHLNIDKFVLVGGSWGSTLSLMYAIAHPNRVAAIVIDGVFTATKAENDWLENGGWQAFFPDVWQEFIESIPEAERQNPCKYLYEQVLSDDKEVAKKAAYKFNSMELAILKLDDKYLPGDYEKYDPSATIIEAHYLSNSCFIPERFMQHNAPNLKVRVYIVQGRYDLICPPQTAFELDQLLPNSQLVWTINGHLRQHEASTVQRLLINKAVGLG